MRIVLRSIHNLRSRIHSETLIPPRVRLDVTGAHQHHHLDHLDHLVVHLHQAGFGDDRNNQTAKRRGSSTRVGTRDSTIVLELVLVVLDYYRNVTGLRTPVRSSLFSVF